MTSICGVYCLYVGCEIHNVPANKMESVHLRFILCLHLNLIQMQTQIIFELVKICGAVVDNIQGVPEKTLL